jgi:hypothetical protein
MRAMLKKQKKQKKTRAVATVVVYNTHHFIFLQKNTHTHNQQQKIIVKKEESYNRNRLHTPRAVDDGASATKETHHEGVMGNSERESHPIAHARLLRS